jgi:signal transduction histidine kinase
MNRLFFRFFLLVMLSITLATFLVYAAISWLFGDPWEQNAARQAAPAIFLLEKFIDQAPQDQWLPRLNKVREVSSIKFDLLPLTQAKALLPQQRFAALLAGQTVIDATHKAFLRRVDASGKVYVGSEDDVLYAHELPIDDALPLKTEALRFVIVALVLLLPIALWSRAHWQGLQMLSKVADEVGHGNLAARAQVARSASIYPLAQHINQMATRIGELLLAQKRLLHAVSHELRTPIARLEFGLELLRDTLDPVKREQGIDAMQGDLAELGSLVNELLAMAKLGQAQALQLDPVELASLCADCVKALAHEAHGREIMIDIDGECQAGMLDARLMQRALGNLLKNALKYGQSRIRLSVQQSIRHGAGEVGEAADMRVGISILVEDDGPGIAPEHRERIFEPFYRLDDSRDRHTGGFGLGLSIVAQAVALHGGSVTVGGSALGGACFTIWLPQPTCAT